jgi:hypothetical protein
MDIGSAFSFVFDDEEWLKKLAIGGGIALGSMILLPALGLGLILLLPLLGYALEVLKNVRDGQPRPLPEWTDFGGFFKTGLAIFGISFIYNIPALILSCAAGTANSLPELMELDSDAAGVIAIAATCLYCVQTLVSILTNAIVPAAWIRYAQFGTFGSAFQFGEVFGFITANLGDYIIAILLSWVAGFIATFGIILCLVGVVFTFFWSFLVSSHLYGQLARKAQMRV